MDVQPGGAGLEGWGSGYRRRLGRPSPLALVASIALHVGVPLAIWGAGVQLRKDIPEFVQYRVRLFSPPPTVEGPPTPVEATTTPVVTPPAPTETKTPVKEAPKTQAAVPKPVEAKPADAKAATGKNARPGPVGGEGIDIAIEGQEFPYPDYLNNIILQLHRYIRWAGAANLTADVVFYIRRDGSVGGIDVKRGSGNFRFDLAAIEAVEQAGRAKAFGPLPKDWQGDRLYIVNTFAPR